MRTKFWVLWQYKDCSAKNWINFLTSSGRIQQWTDCFWTLTQRVPQRGWCLTIYGSTQQKQKHSGALLLASSISSWVPRCVSTLTTSSRENTSVTLGYTSTATCPWRPTCHGLCPVVSLLWVTYTQHPSLRLQAVLLSVVTSQRWSCLESRLRQRHTQRHHKASDGSSAVSAQRGSKIGVQQSQIHTHLTTSARPALATRCWTHKVPPGRSGVPLPQPDSIWWSEYLARELQWAVEVESRRRLRSASSQRLQSYAEHDSEQLATVSSVLPRLVYGLPVDVVASQSLATFKGRLKHFRSNSR